ncbi:uncharacterized protein LOC107266076 [Cephus cinctus]|uniref:Uncharacterized protein LOC107266076 n=1 Tax=Cephus cinctus TaxID=211228 RepID=A0AAJ7FH76_CEPCN|nr:uncharacterized protein LOC107266076 [Cephus cinctus]XP_015591682.1 uncharacterized protein LOC107266076 [Cephus cinctus]
MNKLAYLSCPFTWKMEELPRTAESLIDADTERREMLLFDGNRQDGITFRKLIYAVTKAYDFAENHCLENAMEEVEKSENLFNDLQEKIPNGISIKAFEHMVKGTKCFILQKMNKLNEVESILESLSICEDSFELGTLHGCQSSAWYFYKFAGKEKAIENALIAVELNPKSGLWHFLLAMSLKHVRQLIGKERKPGPKEQAALKTAFKLQPDPLIGIQCAKMYHKLRENEKAKEMCNNVLHMNPTSCIIYLQLALGFIQYHNNTWDKLICKEYSEKTRICLDYVGTRMPKNQRYKIC